ncbi:transporter substrate-binding domain-containing protein [Hahella sp. KA22]|uniref:substrate-binding periplasmic protein n=1 Tax=Hahella sp. KA22 TaxID=1628392 RepID=UPI000FDEDE23|nr:transporter substrate-binding domain-containing protein [Hahella sp. KA22]AZZ91832.1 transporter substrate-binding domain-containing protein [Hahella sp. KA22]QAY55203.1 transporter substrate-binding domain-containing protein [Hahella sp. KA22]
MTLAALRCIGALLLLVWSIAALAANSVNTPGAKQSKTEIRVAIDAWPPFRILDSEEGYSGIDFDLWARLASELKLDIDYVRCPWVRCLKMMEDGSVDAMSGLALRPDRALYMDYLEPPYYSCSTVFYVRKGRGGIVQDYEDLYRIDVGIVTGSAYFQAFDEDEKINKVGVSTEKQLVDMLGRLRLTAIVGTDCQADYEIAQSPYKGQFDKAEYRPGNSVDLYFAISKKSSFREKKDEFSQALTHLLQAGAIEEIRHQYLH